MKFNRYITCISSFYVEEINTLIKEHFSELTTPVTKISECPLGYKIAIEFKEKDYEFSSCMRFVITEFPGNCGILLLYCFPKDKYRFELLLPMVIEMAKICRYNTIMITDIIRCEGEVKRDYEDYGFKKLFSNYNLHSGNTIEIFTMDMELKQK